MRPYDKLNLTRSLPIVELFPVLWADEGADLDEENENKFKDMVIKPSNIVNGVSVGVGMVLGAILFIIGAIVMPVIHYKKTKKPIRCA